MLGTLRSSIVKNSKKKKKKITTAGTTFQVSTLRD
jgi:hypothetical protein